MAIKYLRIGSCDNIFGYDDGVHDSAIETTDPIKAGTPIDPTDVTRLEDIEGRLLSPSSVVNVDNPTELNAITGVLGALILAYQAVGAGGLNEATLYAYDSSGPAVNAPYIMDAQGAGAERWIAIAGKYSVLESHLNDLTATRLMASNAVKKLSSVANLANWIAGTANEITVIDDGDGTITIEGAGSDTNFTVITAMQAGGAGPENIQYKTRVLTLNGGIITTVGAESGWNDI